MSNSTTSLLYDPILPDSETRRFIDYWKKELEKLSSEHILRWALETYGTGIAFATLPSDSNTVLSSLLKTLSFKLPTVDRVHDLLLPEMWTVPPVVNVAESPCANERPVNPLFLAHFYAEHFCRRNESTIQRYPVWIVSARRDHDSSLEDMPVLSWVERFGVLRIAPLARWSQQGIDEKLRRDTAFAADDSLAGWRNEISLSMQNNRFLFDFTLEETTGYLANAE